MGCGYQVVGNVDPRKQGMKNKMSLGEGEGVGCGRMAASPRSRFLVSVINCFVCETNPYLRDLAAVFSKL